MPFKFLYIYNDYNTLTNINWQHYILITNTQRQQHLQLHLIYKIIISWQKIWTLWATTDSFYHATLCTAWSGLSHRKSVHLSIYLSVTLVDCVHMVWPIIISLAYGSLMILVFWRQILSPISNGMTFKFKVKYKGGRQKMWSSALKQLVSGKWWVIRY